MTNKTIVYPNMRSERKKLDVPRNYAFRTSVPRSYMLKTTFHSVVTKVHASVRHISILIAVLC